MQLSVREAARMMNVSERTIYRWIRDDAMPATRMGDAFHFHREEILEWAAARRLALPPSFMRETEAGGPPGPDLASTLAAGGVFHGLQAAGREDALRAVVERMPLPEGVDRAFLLGVLIAREELASTGVGDGVAIPHVRNPMVLPVRAPMISLGFLETPVEFGALDGRPVFALFTLVSPTVRAHLHLLSRLAFVLRDATFRAALDRRAPGPELVAAARATEAALGPASAARP